MAATTISDAEWRVMQLIWEHKRAAAADVIAEICPETGWSHRTVRTLLSRLVDKNVLQATPDGNRYLYRPAVSRRKCVREAGRSFLDRVFSGDAAELLVHFVRQANMTPEQVEQLKQLLDEQCSEED